MRYYNLKTNWRAAKQHLNDKELNDILVSDFNKYTWGRTRREFTYGHYPEEFEGCDWRCDHKGKYPAFWRYAKHGACHWLVNFSLRWAMLVKPNEKWRIITSSKHSTVWNGKGTLFDINFQAMGISANHCFELANKRELKPGRYHKVHFANHYSLE